MRFLIRLGVTAAALWVAVRLVPGITYRGDWLPFLGVALVFGVVNAVVRPVLYALTCPIVLLTLGLFVFVLNGIMLLITAALAGALGIGFTVAGIVPAILGALVVGVVSAILSIFVGEPEKDRRR
ncbi:MAG TPA: phage holin family protein [Longimicrobiales bacterium]|nr:phage holin family protein [Longimicrobiales bacterium]